MLARDGAEPSPLTRAAGHADCCSQHRADDQKDHDLDGSTSEYLRETYGETVRIVHFDKVTRGAMETALLSLGDFDRNVPLLVLDSDNRYNGAGFLKFATTIFSWPSIRH